MFISETAVPILHSLLVELKAEFARSEKGKERSIWFQPTLLAIILPFTSSKTSILSLPFILSSRIIVTIKEDCPWPPSCTKPTRGPP